MKKERILEVNHIDLSFRLGNEVNHVIRDISFHVNQGETLAIVGESGSGKSVTTKAILGMIDENGTLEKGEILFRFMQKGKEDEIIDLAKKDKKFMQKNIRGARIAIIFQDPMTSLDPTMTIGKQIMESMLEHKKAASKKEALAKTIELLTLVGIEYPAKRVKQYPHQLSGGMRQRVVIAIALACEPEMLIADEPTTALDFTIQSQILDLIKELQRKIGLTIIFITHDLGVVANVADRVAVMYAGKIVEEGLASEIYYDPRHPYTWGLLSSIPSLDGQDEEIYSIPGTPPNLIDPPKGDAFAYRSEYALKIDFEEQPPMFQISETHFCASWLMHPMAPKVEMPTVLAKRIAQFRERRNSR
ncbi:MAG: ABC transporter ATP-binding protein [Erysipelotrichales bacterium]|nr:MAG: ABC transporter ATP-binding protein [Erysipelotrichales bacterium]